MVTVLLFAPILLVPTALQGEGFNMSILLDNLFVVGVVVVAAGVLFYAAPLIWAALNIKGAAGTLFTIAIAVVLGGSILLGWVNDLIGNRESLGLLDLLFSLGRTTLTIPNPFGG